MKLMEIRAHRTSDDIRHEQGKNKGPEDLRVFLDDLKNAPDLATGKEIAKRMAHFFALGGKDKFIAAVDKTTSMANLMQLAYNAALKGEKLGVVK